MTFLNHPTGERHFMKNIAESQNIASLRINRIEVTSDTLKGRAVFAPFVRYFEKTDIYPHPESIIPSPDTARSFIVPKISF